VLLLLLLRQKVKLISDGTCTRCTVWSFDRAPVTIMTYQILWLITSKYSRGFALAVLFVKSVIDDGGWYL
jgi:hypothetical protein